MGLSIAIRLRRGNDSLHFIETSMCSMEVEYAVAPLIESRPDWGAVDAHEVILYSRLAEKP